VRQKRWVSIVNTQSIASGSGFASLLPHQIETLLSVGADEMSKPLGQFSKQQRQRLVNPFISMSTVILLIPDKWTRLIAAMLLAKIDLLESNPLGDRLTTAIPPKRSPVVHDRVFHHPAVNKYISDPPYLTNK
jgi:hypothetical protein